MKAEVRRGTAEDAAVGIETLRQSITLLCRADHGDTPEALSRWLANKTETFWAEWIVSPDRCVFVAEAGGEIRGVGMMSTQGEILLNYVHPLARFSGISRALLMFMEQEAHQLGLKRCFLESTHTARDFYLSCGYRSIPEDSSGLLLQKQLF